MPHDALDCSATPDAMCRRTNIGRTCVLNVWNIEDHVEVNRTMSDHEGSTKKNDSLRRRPVYRVINQSIKHAIDQSINRCTTRFINTFTTAMTPHEPMSPHKGNTKENHLQRKIQRSVLWCRTTRLIVQQRPTPCADGRTLEGHVYRRTLHGKNLKL